jgi:hypothetical protein
MQKSGMLLGGVLFAVAGVVATGCSASVNEDTATTEQESERDQRYCIKQEVPLTRPLHWMVDKHCRCDRFAPGTERRDMCDYEQGVLRCMGYSTSCEEARLPELRKVLKNDRRTWVYLNFEDPALGYSCDRVEYVTECVRKLNAETNPHSGRPNDEPIVEAHFTRFCKATKSRCGLPHSTEDVFDPCYGGCITDRYPWQ